MTVFDFPALPASIEPSADTEIMAPRARDVTVLMRDGTWQPAKVKGWARLRPMAGETEGRLVVLIELASGTRSWRAYDAGMIRPFKDPA